MFYDVLLQVLDQIKRYLGGIFFRAFSCSTLGVIIVRFLGQQFKFPMPDPITNPQLLPLIGLVVGYLVVYWPVRYRLPAIRERLVLFIHRVSGSTQAIILNPDQFGARQSGSSPSSESGSLPFFFILPPVMAALIFWLYTMVSHPEAVPTRFDILTGFGPLFTALLLIGRLAYNRRQIVRIVPMALMLGAAVWATLYYYQPGHYSEKLVKTSTDEVFLEFFKFVILMVGFGFLLFDNRRFLVFLVMTFAFLFSLQAIAFESLTECTLKIDKDSDFPRLTIRNTYYVWFLLNALAGAFYTGLRYNLFSDTTSPKAGKQLRIALDIVSYPLLLGTLLVLGVLALNITCPVKNYFTLFGSFFLLFAYYWVELNIVKPKN